MSSVHLQEEQCLILVTGGNKGIGFWVVKKLVEQSSCKNNIILLGSRDLKRGYDAITQLGSPSNVHLIELDTSSEESIKRATHEIKTKYGGQLNVIVNNAGILIKELTIDAARKTFATNYYGIKILNEYLFPFMKENGRIINVSSLLGPMILYQTSIDIQNKYTSSTLTFAELDHLVEDLISSIATDTLAKKGYPIESSSLIYGMSKAALNALTQLEMRLWANKKNLLIVSASPGFCATDMTNNAVDARSPELGADSILYLINASHNDIQNGGFYRDGKQVPFILSPIT